MLPRLDRQKRGAPEGPGANCLESALYVGEYGTCREHAATGPFRSWLEAHDLVSLGAELDSGVRENTLGEGSWMGQGHHQLPAADRLPDPRHAVVPVDQELLRVVRAPERLAVEAQVELPVVALAHDGRRDPAEPLVEVAVGLLRAQDQVGVGGLGGGQVELRQR